MTFDWWTLGLQTVNVLILVWILARFLFRPVAKIVAERQAAAHAALDEADAARDAAEAARAEAEAARAAVDEARAGLIAEAQAAAAQERQKLLDAARADAATARAEARDELDRMRAAAKREMTDAAGALAADIAARLVARLPRTARIDGFIDGLVSAVAALPGETRAEIGRDGPLRLRAAHALTEAERSRVETGLAETLGHPVALAVETDPELIAGLEIDAPHAIVRNTFRADLDRITAEIAAHD